MTKKFKFFIWKFCCKIKEPFERFPSSGRFLTLSQTESAARQAINFCGPFFFLDPGPQTQLNPDTKHFLTV